MRLAGRVHKNWCDVSSAISISGIHNCIPAKMAFPNSSGPWLEIVTRDAGDLLRGGGDHGEGGVHVADISY